MAEQLPSGQLHAAPIGALAVSAMLGAWACAPALGETYDVVISRGVVMDPESGLDAVRNVGISDGSIRVISTASLSGKRNIDARGLVVEPGFIDVHEHGQEPRNYQFQAHDGVTTSLERGQGTFSRVLGHYVREEQLLDLMTALRKMTLLPAQMLEQRAPSFKKKGRLRVGADADITVFDPSRIIDKATFEEPLQYSEGIMFVLVNGVTNRAKGQQNAFSDKISRGAYTFARFRGFER
jgi:N-acyl-D-aspartate/D-glutamate deacylase